MGPPSPMSFECEADDASFGGTYRASCHYAELANIELGDDASFATAAAVLVRQASEVSRAAGSETPPSWSRSMLRGIADKELPYEAGQIRTILVIRTHAPQQRAA